MTTPPPLPGTVLPPEIPAQEVHTPKPLPMPRSYMVWNILATVFMCIIPGIVGIIMSSRVASHYRAGDYEGAARYSSRAALWLMITIVCGLINWPFVMIYSALT